jgi:hypothetical protein
MAVLMSLDISKNEKGRGYWKLNNSLLDNPEYNSGIEALIKKSTSDYKDLLDKRQLWDLCKNKIRQFSIEFSKGNTKERKLRLSTLEEQMKHIYEQIVKDSSNDTLLQEYERVKLEYELLYHHHMKGLIIRSKVKWSQEGEQCTKYFMNLEKRNINKKVITNLVKSDGKNVTNDDDIMQMQVDFYQNLYNSDNSTVKDEFDTFLNDINIQSLSDDSKSHCEGLLNNQECMKALKSMSLNKSPGCDGITAEFYKHHWKLIGHLIIDSFNEAYEIGELASSHRRGVITLLHKGKLLPRNSLDNWRPITLLNIDYKIAAKALATRINKVLPSIINTDQNGFIAKRGVNQNIRLIEDILRYTEEYNLKGAMICIDFKKSF